MTDIMISVEAARARIAAALLPMATEPCKLVEAPGRTLAEPVIAALTQPPFAASAMDGYAVQSQRPCACPCKANRRPATALT